MFILRQFLSLIQLLHSDKGTNSLAFACAYGWVMGLTPLLTLQGLLLLFVLLFFRIQMGMALLSWVIFSLISFLFLPLMDSFGAFILENPALKPLWSNLYDLRFVPLSRFNNTAVRGGLIIGIIGFPFIYFITRFLLKKYRISIGKWVENSKLIKIIKASKLYKWYRIYGKVTA